MLVFGGAMQNYAEVYEKEQAPYRPMLIRCFVILWRRKRDSNPRNSYPFTAFRVRPVRPLRHFSSDWSTAKLRRIFLPAKARCQKKEETEWAREERICIVARKKRESREKTKLPQGRKSGGGAWIFCSACRIF